MKDGFYALFQAGGDQDPDDTEAYGLAILAHFKNGVFVGTDQGGCRVSGSYQVGQSGKIAMQLIYEFKAGSGMADGSTLKADHRMEANLMLAAAAADGAPQAVNIGMGPMYIKLNWLAEAV